MVFQESGMRHTEYTYSDMVELYEAFRQRESDEMNFLSSRC
jgi:hypothetical protein